MTNVLFDAMMIYALGSDLHFFLNFSACSSGVVSKLMRYLTNVL